MFGTKILGVSALSLALAATAFGRVGPVSQYGQLQAGKNSFGKGQIYGACKGVTDGNEVQVQGMSLFWSAAGEGAGSDFWTADIVSGLVERQGIQIIRAPMSVDESGWAGSDHYFKNTSFYQRIMDNVVQAAIDNDIYVIIDYHSHCAEQDTAKAVTFFTTMAQKWGKYDNVIFEIYNEPKGSGCNADYNKDNAAGYWKNTIKPYSEKVITAIRKHSDNLIVAGTPYYDQYPDAAIGAPLNDKNVAYTFHFYAGEDPYRHKISTQGAYAVSAMNAGLPVFVTEWGTSAPSGNGGFTVSYNNEWLAWMNQHKLSGANWSVTKKAETASYFNPSGAWDYSESGKWVNSNIFSKLPTSYTACSGAPVSSSSGIASSSSSMPAGYTDYIDDFEDGDSLAYTGGIWYAYTDIGSLGASTISNTKNKDSKGNVGYKVVIAGDNNTKGMGALTGIKLDQGDNEYEPFVALGVKLNADESAYDLSACNTITYKYKGAAHNFKVEDTAVEDYAYHFIAKLDADSWTQAKISWDMLAQPTWTDNEVALSKKRVSKFTWEVKGDLKGTQPKKNYLYVDDVRCDGIAIKPVVNKPTSTGSSSSAKPASSSSSVKPSSSSVASSSSTVKPSSSSVASSSSTVKPSSSSVASSSSTVKPSSSSVTGSLKIDGDLTQTVAQGSAIKTITISGVTAYSRDSWNIYFLEIPQQPTNGSVVISGTVPGHISEGELTENLTVNGQKVTVTLKVVAAGTDVPESSSSAVGPSSSSADAPTSSDSEDPSAIAGIANAVQLNAQLHGRVLQLSGASLMNVDVFDMQGRPMMNLKNVQGEVSLEALANGNYIVRVRAGSANMTKKIMIK